jgi:DNA transformation protein
MVASPTFGDFLHVQRAPLGHVALRRMFGKTGVFCNGPMLGMMTGDTLYFRVADGNRAIFEEAGSYPPLHYRKQGRSIGRMWETVIWPIAARPLPA